MEKNFCTTAIDRGSQSITLVTPKTSPPRIIKIVNMKMPKGMISKMIAILAQRDAFVWAVTTTRDATVMMSAENRRHGRTICSQTSRRWRFCTDKRTSIIDSVPFGVDLWMFSNVHLFIMNNQTYILAHFTPNGEKKYIVPFADMQYVLLPVCLFSHFMV